MVVPTEFLDGDDLTKTSNVPMPQKVPVSFDKEVLLTTFPEDRKQIILSVLEYFENHLFFWGEYPLRDLPSDIPPECQTAVFSRTSNFVDEREHLAMNEKGRLKRLNQKQLASVRKNGTFTVQSEQFKDQQYVWVLSRLAQKGVDNIRESFLQGMSKVGEYFFVDIPRACVGNEPGQISFPIAIKNMAHSMKDLVNILVGYRFMLPKYSDYQIDEIIKVKRSEFIYENFEFDKTTAETDGKNVFGTFTSQRDGITLNNRFHSIDFETTIRLQIQKIAADVHEEWLSYEVGFQEKLSSDLLQQGYQGDELCDKIMSECTEEEKKWLIDRIKSSFPEHVLTLLFERALANKIWRDVSEEYVQKYQEYKAGLEKELKISHSILYRSEMWKFKKLEKKLDSFVQESRPKALDTFAQRLRAENLISYEFILSRHQQFIVEKKPVLEKTLRSMKVNGKTHTFSRIIWNPKNWKKACDKKGRWHLWSKREEEETHTGVYFWRFWILLKRIKIYFLNVNFYLLLVFLWSGPFSIRALCKVNSFTPGSKICELTGELIPDESTTQPTFCSRLVTLWTNIQISRGLFESAPDTGILGKRFSRFFNQLWNYGIKGSIGTLSIVLVVPILCLLNIFLMFFLSVTSVAWVPMVALLVYLSTILIYDCDLPENNNEYSHFLYTWKIMPFPLTITWKFLVTGVGYIFGTFLIISLCLLLAFFRTLFHSLCWFFRSTWDTFFFYCILKPLARVPATENFLARCTAGPGISFEYFQQITVSHALVLLENSLEAERFRLFTDFHRARIEVPRNLARELYGQMFSLFSSGSYTLPDQINSSCNKWNDRLNELTRESKFSKKKYIPDRHLIRMTEKELTELSGIAMIQVQNFFTKNVFPFYLPKELFFRSKNLPINDWTGLTKMFLEETFSPSFLTPLEESDKSFSLEVDHVGVREFFNSLKDNLPRDDLDKVRVKIPIIQLKNRVPINTTDMMLRYYFPAKMDSLAIEAPFAHKYFQQNNNQKQEKERGEFDIINLPMGSLTTFENYEKIHEVSKTEDDVVTFIDQGLDKNPEAPVDPFQQKNSSSQNVQKLDEVVVKFDKEPGSLLQPETSSDSSSQNSDSQPKRADSWANLEFFS